MTDISRSSDLWVEDSPCPAFSGLDNGLCSHYIKGGYCSTSEFFRCPEYIIRNEPPLSYSAIDTYCHCHRKFYWSYLKGLESLEKSWALKLGSCASHILGLLHNASIPIDEAVAQYKEYMSDLIDQTVDSEEEDLKYGHIDAWKMKALFDGYIALDFHTMRGEVEKEFRWSEPGLPKVHGYIDYVDLSVYENHIGYEFKYTTDSDRYTKLTIGDQIMTYFIGAPTLQRITNRCFVPPGYRQKKATKKQVGESMLDFYERVLDDVKTCHKTKYFIDKSYWRSEFDLDQYKAKAASIAREIITYINMRTMEPFYQNKKACYSPFMCDFIRVCENEIYDPENLVDSYRQRQRGGHDAASLK